MRVRYVPKRTVKRLLDAIHTASRVTRNALMWRVGRSDYKRWSSSRGLEEWWDERTKAIAKLVPAGSRVIEFGAGRRQLETLLPVGCTYTASDLVDRGAGTLVCDLNRRPLPDLSHVTPDVSVFGGVLEYIRDVPALIRWLADAGVKTCVVSFDPLPIGLGILGRYRKSVQRFYYGYMNSLTEKELLRSFEAAGFISIQRQTWTTQVIFQFRRQP